MREQHASTQPIHATVVACVAGKVEFGIHDGALPLANIRFAMRLKRLCQRLEQLRRRALVTATKRNGDCEFTVVREIDLAGQCDVALLGCLKFPVHFEVMHQVLPAVAKADIAHGSAREISAACHDKVNTVALRVDQFAVADFRTPSGVAGANATQVRRQ